MKTYTHKIEIVNLTTKGFVINILDYSLLSRETCFALFEVRRQAGHQVVAYYLIIREL